MWSRSNSCRPAIDPADPMGEARIKRIAVIGGGIAGLAAAHRLTEIAHERNSALEILLFEAREREIKKFCARNSSFRSARARRRRHRDRALRQLPRRGR